MQTEHSRRTESARLAMKSRSAGGTAKSSPRQPPGTIRVSIGTSNSFAIAIVTSAGLPVVTIARPSPEATIVSYRAVAPEAGTRLAVFNACSGPARSSRFIPS